ncbi:hypothetical protein B0H10DRAFT_2227164 [Mycena sp. CBHHK59/15]|nr:hypothetical protein B0H10DRAFT_2227164 [Mycena sp. CBHHK59/15]
MADSEITESTGRPLIMEFATNSVRNTTLAATNDDPYFEVVTRFWHPNLTKINKLDPETGEMHTICEIDKKGSGKAAEVRVRFVDEDKKRADKRRSEIKKDRSDALGDWMSAEEILKMAPERPGGVFIDPEGVEYRWKTHNRKFQLIRCDDVARVPVAVYHPYKRHFFVWRMSKHASLEVKPQMAKYLERLIATYLLVERQRRHHTF